MVRVAGFIKGDFMKKILLIISFLSIAFLFFSCQKEVQRRPLKIDEREKIGEISEGTFITNQKFILKNKETLTNATSLKFIIKKQNNPTSKIPIYNYNIKMFITTDKEYEVNLDIKSDFHLDSYSSYFNHNSNFYNLNITFRKNKIFIHSGDHTLNNTSRNGIYYNYLFLELTKI